MSRSSNRFSSLLSFLSYWSSPRFSPPFSARSSRVRRLAPPAVLAAIAIRAVVLTTTGCTPLHPSAPTNDYVGAAVFGGSALAATGVNRAITKDCWANCSYGTQCDHESGTCVPLPCSSHCPADLRCERVGGRDICVQRRSEAPPFDAGTDASPDAGAEGGSADPRARGSATPDAADAGPDVRASASDRR